MSTAPSLLEVTGRTGYDTANADHARRALRDFVTQCGDEAKAARELKLPQPTFWRYMNGQQQPPLRVLIALSKKTGRSLDDILGLRTQIEPADIQEFIRKAAFEQVTSLADQLKSGLMTASQYAAGGSRTMANRHLTAAVNVEHGKELKSREEWKAIFAQKKSDLSSLRRSRKKKPGPHGSPGHRSTG